MHESQVAAERHQPSGLTDPGSTAPQTAGRRRLLQALVITIPIVAFAALCWRSRFLYDDGYIYLHVVQQILHGNGPVYNVGQRVETYTGPLWVAILVPTTLLSPLSSETSALVAGILLAAIGLGGAAVGSTLLMRRAEPGAFVLPFGLLVPVAIFSFWAMSASGLETGLAFAWIGICTWLCATIATSDTGRPSLWQMVVLGLGPLVRPELVIFSLVLIGVLLGLRWRQIGPARAVRLAVAAAVLPALYELFRMGYFGMLVANTAIAKEASRPDPLRGLRYLENFSSTYWLVVPLLLLIPAGAVPLWRRLRRDRADRLALAMALALPAAGVLTMAYITLVGGDYIHGRLLLPGAFAVCAPFAVLPARRSWWLGMAIVPWVLIVGLAVRPPTGVASVPFLTNQPISGHVNWLKGWGPTSRNGHLLHHRALFVQSNALFYPTVTRVPAQPAPGLRLPALITNAIGTPAVALGPSLTVFDMYGLANPIGSHLELKSRGLLAGHEKSLPTPWVMAMTTAPGSSARAVKAVLPRPTFFDAPEVAASGDGRLDAQVAYARAALACPELKGLLASSSAPLSAGRFLSNVWHAAEWTTMRIPLDPEVAYHRYCSSPASAQARSG